MTGPRKCYYVIAKTWKLPKRPSTTAQVNTGRNIHTALGMNKLQPHTVYSCHKVDDEQKKPDQKIPYDSIVKVWKQANVIYSAGSLGRVTWEGTGSDCKSTGRTSPVQITLCLDLAAGCTGVSTCECAPCAAFTMPPSAPRGSTPIEHTHYQPKAAVSLYPLATSLDLEPWRG